MTCYSLPRQESSDGLTQQTFSANGQTVSTLGFVGYQASAGAT